MLAFSCFCFGCSVYDSSLLAGGGDGGADGDADACGKVCGGKCVDVSSDPGNCGDCGRTCETTCESGACTPTVLASGVPGPRAILVDDQNVYFADHGSISVESMSKVDGSGRTVVAGAQVFPERLTTDGTRLYWTNDSDVLGSFDSVFKTGGQSYILARDIPSPSGIAVSNGFLYVATSSPNNASACTTDAWTDSILKCSSTAGCYVAACTTTGGPLPIATQTGASPLSLAVNATTLYWTSYAGKAVYSCPLPDCAGGPQPFATGLSGPTDIVVNNGYVYFTDTAAGSVLRCGSAGCSGKPQVVVTGQADPEYLAVDDTNVYFSALAGSVAGQGQVLACALPSCAGGPIVVATGANAPYGVAVDADYVYWVEEGTAGSNSVDGRILKVKKP